MPRWLVPPVAICGLLNIPHAAMPREQIQHGDYALLAGGPLQAALLDASLRPKGTSASVEMALWHDPHSMPHSMVMVQGAYRTAKEDFQDMLKILTRNTPEPIRVSAIMNPSSEVSHGAGSHLSSHHELESAVALLLHAAWLLDPDEVKFVITRLIFNQVGMLLMCWRGLLHALPLQGVKSPCLPHSL